MRTNPFTSWSSARVAVASAAVAGLAVLAACSEGGVANVAGPSSPSVRLGVLPSIANATFASVCVNGPAGNYVLQNSNFVDSVQWGGSVKRYDDGAPGFPAVGSQYTLTVLVANTPKCQDILIRKTAGDAGLAGVGNPGYNPGHDPFTLITVTLVSTPAGTAPAATTCDWDPGNLATAPCALSPVIHANSYHGSKTTFNAAPVASHGCTYTFGWYKNQGNATVPNSSFFGTAWSWKTVLAFKGQGNLYYTLADQYIPAKLNGGSNGPPAVKQAIIDAETFFTGRALGSTTGYSAATLNAITKTVNDFNDGLNANWPHC